MKNEQIGKQDLFSIELAFRVKRFMRSTGESIEDFAKKCGLSESTILAVINQSDITSTQALQICDYLKIDMNVLIVPPEKEENFLFMVNAIKHIKIKPWKKEYRDIVTDFVNEIHSKMDKDEVQRNVAWIEYMLKRTMKLKQNKSSVLHTILSFFHIKTIPALGLTEQATSEEIEGATQTIEDSKKKK